MTFIGKPNSDADYTTHLKKKLKLYNHDIHYRYYQK
ncbi:hypothetical protein PMI10_02119 [Flavobacterium sp. CF136]|nr:hypothetical protein PMI10_02119 [Flavobacterium sp. CF136]